MERRTFLSTSAAATAGFLGLQKYLHAQTAGRVIEPYGPLVADTNGILDLPKGFRYNIISKKGATMSDGYKVPGMPDGMACFPGRENTVILIRNHELGIGSQNQSPFPEAKFPRELDSKLSYDPGRGKEPPHVGGTTNIVYDLKSGEVLREFLSLSGTDRNCAGGATPWNTWITCEEPADLTSDRGRDHGYCFEVTASDDGKLQKAVALKKLGRFRHEAIAVDPSTGIIYLTEDMGDGLFYRFVPEKPRDFTKGKLQALAIVGQKSADLRNFKGQPQTVKEGEQMKAEWITMSRTDAPENDLRYRGFDKGAARFARGEGIQWTDGSMFICCTNGGPEAQGQIFKLTPSGKASQPDTLELFLQPESADLLTNGDNICATPWGDLVVCEDLIAEHKGNTPHVRGVTQDGKIYNIARNALNRSEFAGSCFSPDGSTMFVNMQSVGYTLAVTGPWQKTV
ncbi:MAG: alkaline phosphatase PhoX [Akkermansiaceae bacterium]